MLRRQGLPRREPLRLAARRLRRLHDVRGRQHRAAAAGRQDAAVGLRLAVRGPRRRRHGPPPDHPVGDAASCPTTGPLGRFTRDDAELRDASWQAETLRFREERLVDSLARRLRRLVNGRAPGPAARAVALPGPRADGRHRARRAHRARAVRRCRSPRHEDAATRQVLDAAARPLRAHGHGAGPRLVARARLLRRRHRQGRAAARSTSCAAQLRPAALGLVEAFGIPDALLRAPIAVAEQRSGAGTD